MMMLFEWRNRSGVKSVIASDPRELTKWGKREDYGDVHLTSATWRSKPLEKMLLSMTRALELAALRNGMFGHSDPVSMASFVLTDNEHRSPLREPSSYLLGVLLKGKDFV
jgi:hypothetical protein